MVWFLFLIANISLGEEITGKDSTKLRGCIDLIKAAIDQELIELEDRTLISTDDFYELFQNEVALNCYEKISKEEARLILEGETNLKEFVWLIKLSSQEVRYLFEERQNSFQAFGEYDFSRPTVRGGPSPYDSVYVCLFVCFFACFFLAVPFIAIKS